MTMKKIYFLIITFSLVTSVQAAHKKKPKTPPVTIPGKDNPEFIITKFWKLYEWLGPNTTLMGHRQK